jgi:hypothetical protein
MKLKSFAALALAAVMTFTQPLTAFANNVYTEPTNTASTAGYANILDFNVETIVVPTNLKMAINPKSYPITTTYEKTADTAVTNTKDQIYFTKKVNSSGYAAVTPASATTANIKEYFVAKTSSNQIVSLNYGIANRSNMPKNISVKVEAAYADTKAEVGVGVSAKSTTSIEFVDSASKAAAYSATNTGGAAKGALKMYLELVSAASGNTPTAVSFKEVPVDSTSAYVTYVTGNDESLDKILYKKEYSTRDERHSVTSAPYAKIESSAAATTTHTYIMTNVIGADIRSHELGDVKMTPATTQQQVFTAKDNGAESSIAFTLAGAKYELEEGETIDFDTTQSQFDSKLKLTEIGGYASFTITGVMNANANWTLAEPNQIKFTPIYEVTDTDDTEEVLGGTWNQIVLGPSATLSTDGVITVNNLAEGQTVDSVDLTYTASGEEATESVTNDISWDDAGTTGTLASVWVDYLTGKGRATITLNLSGDESITASAVF